MLINQAKQLEQLPTTVLNDVERDFSQIQNLLRHADGIACNVKSIDRAFTQTYPNSISSTTSDRQMIDGARQRWQESPSAYQRALALGAGAALNLSGTQTETSSLRGSSQSSVGILPATQAGNQLIAVQARELADLTALLTAQGRAQRSHRRARQRPRAKGPSRPARMFNVGNPGPQIVENAVVRVRHIPLDGGREVLFFLCSLRGQGAECPQGGRARQAAKPASRPRSVLDIPGGWRSSSDACCLCPRYPTA